MSLSALADSVLFPGFAGTAPPAWVRRRVAGGLGGVVLFARNCESPAQLAELTGALRAERPDVLIATDEEGGDVTRLYASTGSPVPGPYALGVVDDVELTRSVAGALAARVGSAGIGWTLGPVADVNSAPDNPVIGVRSFGPSADLVSRHVVAAVRGIQAAGVAACVKHFPGHGDTIVDSHLGVPTVGPDLDGALAPFRAAVDAGVASVMTGHLLVPAFGPQPATVNRGLITGLLRGDLGFDGVVISDALEMGAIAGTVGLGEGAVLALLAGVDALCLGGDEAGEPIADTARDALVAAVRAGRLPEDRLAEASARISTLGARFAGGPGGAGSAAEAGSARFLAGPGGAGSTGSARFPAGAAGPGVEGLGLDAARRAARVVGDARLPAGAPVVVQLDPAPTIAVGYTRWGLAGLLPGATELRVGPEDPLPTLPAGRPLVIVARDAPRVGWVGRAVDGLLAAHPGAVVVEMGLPGPAPVPPAAGWIATGGASTASGRAAAELLLGSGDG
jgi:beta-N-acetylhexosaminidase